MNYLMIIVGIAIFFYGYTQNRKMRDSFKNLYEEAVKNQSEQDMPTDKISEEKIETIVKELDKMTIDDESKLGSIIDVTSENIIEKKVIEKKVIEKKVIEKQIMDEEEKYNIIEKIKNAKDKKTFYKEIIGMLHQYEDESFREEIAKATGINKGELLLLKNMYKK